jgi:hypothetical protein
MGAMACSAMSSARRRMFMVLMTFRCQSILTNRVQPDGPSIDSCMS